MKKKYPKSIFKKLNFSTLICQMSDSKVCTAMGVVDKSVSAY